MRDHHFCLEPSFYYRAHGTAFGHQLGSLAMVHLPIVGGTARASARAKQLKKLGLDKLARFSKAVIAARGRDIPRRRPNRFETVITAKLKGFRLQSYSNENTQEEEDRYHPPLFEAGEIIGSIYSLYDERQDPASRQSFFVRHPNLPGFRNSDIREAFVLGHRIEFVFDQQLANAGHVAELAGCQNLVQPVSDSTPLTYSLVKRIRWEDESSAEKLEYKGYIVQFGEKCGQEFFKGQGHTIQISYKGQNKPLAVLRFGEVLRSKGSTRLVMLNFQSKYSKALRQAILRHGNGAYEDDYSSGKGVGSDVGSNGKPLRD